MKKAYSHKPTVRTVALYGIAGAAALFAAGCGKDKEEAGHRTADSLAMSDSIPIENIIEWKAYSGIPLYDYEIDSVIEYFRRADAWTKANARSVRTPADFDSLDARYTHAFPLLDMYSVILEENADVISDRQMQRLQATALSLGDTLDSLAKAVGLDPAQLNPFHQQETITAEKDNNSHS